MKTAKEKLEKPIREMPKIVDIPEKMQKRWGTGKLLIPNPLDIEKLIKKTKKGKLITFKQIREKLARKFKVDFTCPITTGIFTRLIAEREEENKTEKIPWWRVIRDDGSLNEKFPSGIKKQKDLLEKEGHVIEKGKIKNFKNF